MNLTTLIKQYFHSSSNDVTIDVFKKTFTLFTNE